MRQHLGGRGWWFDTSALTPEETAEQLVREVDDRAALVTGEWGKRVSEIRDALAQSDRLRDQHL